MELCQFLTALQRQTHTASATCLDLGKEYVTSRKLPSKSPEHGQGFEPGSPRSQPVILTTTPSCLYRFPHPFPPSPPPPPGNSLCLSSVGGAFAMGCLPWYPLPLVLKFCVSRIVLYPPPPLNRLFQQVYMTVNYTHLHTILNCNIYIGLPKSPSRFVFTKQLSISALNKNKIKTWERF